MKSLLKFYGSCGHEPVIEITEEEFARWSAPRITKPLSGGEVTAQNEVTVEGDTRTVHVYPDRFCICADCMEKQDDSEEGAA